jgi:hypothetical protein
MAVLPTGIGPVTGYNIERSLRFNNADSAYLSRTFSAASTNVDKQTVSFWFKRSQLTNTSDTVLNNSLITQFGSGGNYPTYELGFEPSSDQLVFMNRSASATYNYRLVTTQQFRDPSAWYHLVIAYDSSLATSTDRIKMWINGTQITAFSTATYPAQNLDSQLANNAFSQPTNIGGFAGSRYFTGYMTEINFIDGQALTPSDFGETDSNTGVWKPKAFSGTYGTNGFYLKFADNSGTTSTTLGKDSSGNGNNWTPNNFSVTAGVGNDSLVDSPTSYGTDTGVGGTVRGNYATFNALTTTGNTLTNGNLDAAAAAAAWRGSFSTIGVSSGKWYMEFTIVGGTFARQIIGIALNSAVNSASFYGYGFVSGGQLMGRSVGAIPVDYSSGTLTSLSPTTDFDNGDVVGLCIDADAGKLWVFKNNTIIEGTVNGTANVTWTANSLVFPVASMYSGDSVYANFGQRAFAYTAPSGFKALCTQNLPTPTIGATSTTQANDYFNAVLYTGNGTSQTITGVGFQPDFVWAKGRSFADFHVLEDVIRGATKSLSSDLTTAEVTRSTALTAFTSDGFSVGSDTLLNYNANTFVAWNWKANGAGSSNTAGSITSTVSASTTSGFSIVTWTGTGSNATVGHGLGVAPSMIISKVRTTTDNWIVGHEAIPSSPWTKCLFLNTTGGINTNAAYWNNTAPTSSVFTTGTWFYGSENYVAYCFAPVAGYSAFGSYTGNGSSDGPFAYLGFRPEFVLLKRSSAAGNNWLIYDSARDTYNVVAKDLYPNTSGAEASGTNMDFLSNGFKIRASGDTHNGSGSTYIYAAFAESPFKYALAR